MLEIEKNTDASDNQSDQPSGYEIVADLLNRQEEVLTQLDELNQRVESTIQAIIDARPASGDAPNLENPEENPSPESVETFSAKAA